ncbi:hypothetical protein K3G63_22400 [Hymenobacter sp. HSC-4F20]|uniref:hypothetical protein n=1 Tax=Hymenobacter sp. HSC-4F20 TaxID=2864135 RepID=UPI001C739BE1|nr:hypothetical protein [Hymenobacter sp. HSC-4F20]MBX0293213.1 hypothetical protein [Hymenobacter sp. HSC-4F20]
MQHRTTYYSNQALAGQAPARAQAYAQRVQADGGTVTDMLRVEAAYRYLDSLPPATTGIWISPYFGNRVNAAGQVERAYCLFGNDLRQATAATSLVTLQPTGLNGHRCYATNQGALQVDNPGFHLNTTEATVATVFSTDNMAVTVLLEYSPNMNTTRGFVVSVEDGATHTMTLHHDAGYAIAALPGAQPGVPATLLGTWNLARPGRESRLLVDGVRADYSRHLYGTDYNADNPAVPLPPQPLWIGARNGTGLAANILLGDLCLLNREMVGASETALYELVQQYYQPDYVGSIPTTGLQGWWSADSGVVRNDAGQVTEWLDRSPNQLRMVAEPGTAPLTVAEHWANGRPAIRFDGNGAFLPLTLPQAAPTAYTVALVLHKQPQATNGMPCMFGQNVNYANDLWVSSDCFGLNNFNSNIVGIAGAETRLTRPVVVLAELHNNQTLAFRLWLNGEAQPVSQMLAGAIDRPLDNVFRLGDATFHEYGAYRWQGCIAEALVYDRTLNPAEQTQLQQYLLGRYQLAPAASLQELSTGPAAPVNRVRYYPRDGFTSRMVGGQLQGSPDGRQWTTLYTIGTEPPQGQFTEVTFPNTTSYRYVRYLAPYNAYGNITELEVYHDGQRLLGMPFGTPGAYAPGCEFDKAFDGNPATFFDAPNGAVAEVGLDLERPAPVALPAPTHYLAANAAATNQYLLVPVPALETVTLSFWLWKDSAFTGGWEYVLDWRDTVQDSWFATHGVGSNWDWYVDGVRRTGHNLADTLELGVWHHCILQLRVPAPAGNLTFGSRYSLNEQMRNIRVADLRVYSRHFTPVEVLNYERSPTDSLVSHYEFRQDTSTTASDSVGGHHASLYNF